MKYKKYFRKTSLKQKGVGDFFLSEVKRKSPKTFLEVGVFHGVTARNICELLYSIHKNEFKYVGLDLFEKNDENRSEVIPNTNFSNPIKKFFFKYIKKQDPYSKEASLLYGSCFLIYLKKNFFIGLEKLVFGITSDLFSSFFSNKSKPTYLNSFL